MNNLPKNILLPAFFGMLFYFFLFFGINSELISKNQTISLIAISLGVIVLYTTVIGLINNRLNLDIGYSGFKLSVLFFGFIIPIILNVYKFFFQEPTVQYESILEKENIDFIVDYKKCERIKYGTFLIGIDTLKRYSEDEKDYEVIKTHDNEISISRIKWIDSCSYMRYNEANGLLTGVVKLGNFMYDIHDLHSKPGGFHKLSDEKIEMVTELIKTSKPY